MARKLILLVAALVLAGAGVAQAQQGAKPNIILILSDDFGYGDSGPYGGGAGRGMPTPSLDRLANEGMTFYSFYGQPSCTPGRAAAQTGRIPSIDATVHSAAGSPPPWPWKATVVMPLRSGPWRRC